MIPMRDDVKLSTQLLFPKIKQEKYPVVLVRTPYKKERRAEEYNYIIENGYVLVLQDVRGRFGSEGIFEPFVKESKDGYDVIEWIARQPWCDGNIGMIGGSYNGLVQYAAAAEQPPSLRTIIPNVAMVDPYRHGAYANGIFTPGSLIWCAIIEKLGTDEEIYAKDWGKLLNHLPTSALDSIIFSRELDYYQKWVQHESKDSYWKQGSTLEKLSAIQIPVFVQSGWFDSQLHSNTLAYEMLTDSGNPNVKMIIGPWGHTDRESKSFNGEFMGEAADDINLQTQYIRWLDYWLKHKDNGIMDEPLVEIYAINSNTWYNDDSYPFRFTTDKKLYLSSTNKPDLGKNGELTFNRERINEGVDTFIYNPGDVPVFIEKMFKRGKYDLIREMLSEREDYLFYKTTGFSQETTIIGPIQARIYAATSAVDTDWFTILVLLDEEDKFIDLISSGLIRAKFRNSFENAELLEEEKIIQYDIDMTHYGLKLQKGEKLGLIVTSSWGYPLLGKNLNTGKNNQLETDYEIAKQKIYHTKESSSYISIPVLNSNMNKLINN